MPNTKVLLSILIVLVGLMDCLTTVLGVQYFGAAESNPFMATMVSANIGAFLTVKIAATMLIALTYVLANRALLGTSNKASKLFKYSCRTVELAYGGIIVFLAVTVTNNLLILLV
jgi:hypothetical protein